MDVSAASTKADTIQAKNVSLDVAAGSMTIDQFTINDKVSIDCSAGDIKLGSKNNAAKNVCNNLKADCSAGTDTTVYCDVSLDCTMGNIKVTFYS